MKPFPSIFQIHITIIFSPRLLIHFFCYFGKRKLFVPPGAYAFLTTSVHVPLDTVFNQIREFSVKDRGSNETLGKIEADF